MWYGSPNHTTQVTISYLLNFMKGLIVSVISLFSLAASAQSGRHIAAYTQFGKCEGVERVWHTPTYYDQNPVLKADRKWELNATGDPYAAPFSGGVWYDETVGKFKMW